MTYERLRVCLICEDISLPIDEGIKKFVDSVRTPLTQRAELLVLSVGRDRSVPESVHSVPANRFLLSRAVWKTIRGFKPDALIYVPIAAATRNSFLRCAILQRYAPGAQVIMVSLQPRTYGPAARRLIRHMGPKLTLVQSTNTCDALTALGVRAAVIPSGVDLNTFVPVGREEKLTLRKKYQIPPHRYTVLHVGHLKQERNVLLLNRIRSEIDCETVVVGSTSTPSGVEVDVTQTLRAGGTHVIDHYIDQIAELYQLADCYLFPVHATGGAIEAPLSVLEALACDLPVVTTPFGFLRRAFTESAGFVFADNDDDLVFAVERMQQNTAQLSVGDMRAQALPFSWDAIADILLAALRHEGNPGVSVSTHDVVESVV